MWRAHLSRCRLMKGSDAWWVGQAHIPVKAGMEGQGVLGWPSCPQGSSRALLVDVTVSQGQVCAHSGLCPIWEPQGERVEGH